MEYNIIVSHSKNNVIGNNNYLPWSLPSDIQYFKKITSEKEFNKPNIVLMGFNTWSSIPCIYKPLSNRINIILSRNNHNRINENEYLYVVKSHSDFLELCNTRLKNKYNKIFIIGGKSIYQYYLSHPNLNRVYVTYIKKDIDGNVVFPNLINKERNFILESCSEYQKENDLEYQYRIYKKTDSMHSEYQYLSLCKKILEKNNVSENRTKIKTKSIFGHQMRFNLKEGFPLLTTKKMYTKAIIEELLWFLNGKTDAVLLQDKGIKIWDGNSSREYLDSIGLIDNRVGDCGPIYGFNFRHYGAKYHDCDTDYSGKGYDQVQECLRLIKEEPNSRRIIINLWNPNILDKSCLPPCHVLYQFTVNDGELSCSMYQRSGDFGLGIPFNIASASLLTHIFAKLCNLKVGEFIHTIGDCHIYENHLKSLTEQILRHPSVFPTLKIRDNNQSEIEDFTREDFSFLGYDSYPSLKMDMVV